MTTLHSRYRCRFTEAQAQELEQAEPGTAGWTIVDCLNDAAAHIPDLVEAKQHLAGQVRRLLPVVEATVTLHERIEDYRRELQNAPLV